MADADDPSKGQIDLALVRGSLVHAFPGVEVKKSTALGRRLVFKVEFPEFVLTVTTPETTGMRKSTTLTFRRIVEYQLGPDKPTASHQVFNYTDTFTPEEGDRLKKTIWWAREYVMGIIAALSAAVDEPRSPPRPLLA
jgi:hypothetical protein